MSAKSIFLMAVVVGLCGLVTGCADDSIVSTSQQPLPPPSNLVVTPTPSGAVIVTWDAVTQGGLVGYNVYRTLVGTANVDKLTSSPMPETTYLDVSATKGMTYEYRVTSVGVSGSESSFVALAVAIPDLDQNKRDREES